MEILEELEEKYAGSELLRGFEREESVALMDLAFLVIMIDEEVTQEELMQLTKRVVALTFEDVEEAEALIDEHGVTTREAIRAIMESEEPPVDFIEARSDKFADDDHRAKALEVLGTVAYSDGLDEEEEGICHQIGRVFGFEDERIEELLVAGAVDLWELGSDNVR